MTGTAAVTVLLVDDHPVVREGLRAMLSVEPEVIVVGEAANGREAIEAYFRLKPDVTLMDLLLPDIGGNEVIRSICAKSPEARIIVMTSASGDAPIYEALELGARGYLFKDMARLQLLEAIRRVQNGQRFIPAEVGERLAEHLARLDLTTREIAVLQLVAAGKRNKEIAYELHIAEATANSHVKHILEKLGASDRTEAVTTALRRGFLRL